MSRLARSPGALGVTRVVAALVLVLATLACRPARGANGAADSAVPHASTSAFGAMPADQTELTLSVREVLETPGLVRRRVRVTGTCLGYASAGDAATPPPITRSDWILEAGDARVFVSGPFPDGCTATTRGSQPVTIVGEVAEDTLPPFGTRPAVPRRFLLRIR